MANKLFKEEQEYIIQNYPIFGPKAVAAQLKRSQVTVSKYAKENGLVLKSRKERLGLDIPEFDNSYITFSKRFNNISKELSYWIGFFWADGSACIGHSLTIEITEEDGKDLKDLFLKVFPFKISYRKREGRKPQMSFYVTDKEVTDLFYSLGKYPKSSESHEKILRYLNNKDLIIYFLRGLIDGDGNFYINNNEKYCQFTLASNYNQDWSGLLTYLKDFNPNIYRSETIKGNSSGFRITGRNNLINFIKYLKYDSDNIGLKRKVTKANDIIKFYNDNPPRESKHIYQYDLNNNLIKEWKSLEDIYNVLNFKKSGISNNLNGLSKSSHGYIWRYK